VVQKHSSLQIKSHFFYFRVFLSILLNLRIIGSICVCQFLGIIDIGIVGFGGKGEIVESKLAQMKSRSFVSFLVSFLEIGVTKDAVSSSAFICIIYGVDEIGLLDEGSRKLRRRTGKGFGSGPLIFRIRRTHSIFGRCMRDKHSNRKTTWGCKEEI
jgi:hypothetical protein